MGIFRLFLKITQSLKNNEVPKRLKREIDTTLRKKHNTQK